MFHGGCDGEWRERLGLGREAEWDERIARIAKLPVKDGKYVAIETTPETWDNKESRHDHPAFLTVLSQLPGDGVDVSTMRRTLEAVLGSWDWETKIWGWDYPMAAMTAARLGEREKAVDVLLFTKGPNNDYKPNGHCPQRGDLPVYLPANGALLAAVAMMAGWMGWRAGRCGAGFSERWIVGRAERRVAAVAVGGGVGICRRRRRRQRARGLGVWECWIRRAGAA